MPGQRWGSGWSKGNGSSSACPRRIARFLEPCLLLLLREDANHGYNLLDALRGFGFAKDSIDASVVYRVLREMEQAGWVSSAWDTAGSGPPRRIYQLTASGGGYLRLWIDDLQRARDEIDNLIAAYQRHRAAALAGDRRERQDVPN